VGVLEINNQLKKRMKKPKRKMSDHRRLVKACLKAWGKVILSRAPAGMCEYCSVRPVKDPHHIVVRGTSPNPGWFELDNGVALCGGCHRFNGPHCGDPEKVLLFQDWIKNTYLFKKDIDYDTLYIKCRARGKLTVFDLEYILKKMKMTLDNGLK